MLLKIDHKRINMETIIIIIIAITLILLIGTTIRANRAKKEKVDPLSPTQVKGDPSAKDETSGQAKEEDNKASK